MKHLDLWDALLKYKLKPNSPAKVFDVAKLSLNKVITEVNATLRRLYSDKPLIKLHADYYTSVLVALLPDDESKLRKLSKQLNEWDRHVASVSYEESPESGRLSNSIYQICEAIECKLRFKKSLEETAYSLAGIGQEKLSLNYRIFYTEKILALEHLCLDYDHHLEAVLQAGTSSHLHIADVKRSIVEKLRATLYDPRLTLVKRLLAFCEKDVLNNATLNKDRDTKTMTFFKGVALVLASVFGVGIGGVYAYGKLFKPKGAVFNEKVKQVFKVHTPRKLKKENRKADLEMDDQTKPRNKK